MLNSVLGAISTDVAIDLGTSNTLLYVAGRGVVCNEPSVVAIHEGPNGRRRIVAVGEAARTMEARTPEDIQAIRPLKDGSIADYEIAEAMLRNLMVRAQGRRLWVGPRVAMCIPWGTTEVEKRAARESAEASGAREVFLVERPVALAVGLGLPIHQAHGHMVVDFGGGTTSIAVLSLGGVVRGHTLKVGGDAMNQAIAAWIEEHLGLAIGAPTAEAIKKALGTASPVAEATELRVLGKDVERSFPREVTLTRSDVREALAEPLQLIAEAIVTTLDATPPELAADVAEAGIVASGGAALLPGLDRYLRAATGLPVIVSDTALVDAVVGAGTILEDATMLVAAAC